MCFPLNIIVSEKFRHKSGVRFNYILLNHSRQTSANVSTLDKKNKFANIPMYAIGLIRNAVMSRYRKLIINDDSYYKLTKVHFHCLTKLKQFNSSSSNYY